jgi:hypothetical protein
MLPEIKEARNGGNRPSLGSKEEIRTALDTATDSTSQGFLVSQRASLDRLTDDLEAIADWRDELQRKIRIAHLKFELVDCFDTAEQERLEAEVRAFKETCARLSETMLESNEQPRRKVA